MWRASFALDSSVSARSPRWHRWCSLKATELRGLSGPRQRGAEMARIICLRTRFNVANALIECSTTRMSRGVASAIVSKIGALARNQKQPSFFCVREEGKMIETSRTARVLPISQAMVRWMTPPFARALGGVLVVPTGTPPGIQFGTNYPISSGHSNAEKWSRVQVGDRNQEERRDGSC